MRERERKRERERESDRGKYEEMKRGKGEESKILQSLMVGYKLQIATDFCAKPILRNFLCDNNFYDSLFLRQNILRQLIFTTSTFVRNLFDDKQVCATVFSATSIFVRKDIR